MKHFLLFLSLSILLTSAICSCRAFRQSAVEYSDTASISVIGIASTLSKEDILSIFSASRELDLSGIKVEFYPPDSVHPNSRAAPKSFSIENVKAKESAEGTTHATAAVEEQETVNLSAQSSSAIQQDSRSNTDILHPPDWVLLCSILSAIIILFLIFLIKSRK